MQERLLKLLLIGGGGLLLSPLLAVGAWTIFGSMFGNVAIVFVTAGWFWLMRHFVSRNHPFPVALTWEEEQRRKVAQRQLGTEIGKTAAIAHSS